MSGGPWQQIFSILTAPQFPDRNKTRVSQATNLFVLMFLVSGICYVIVGVSLPHLQLRADKYVVFALLSFSIPLLFLRLGYVRAASVLSLVLFWLAATVLTYTNGGVSAPASSFYFVLVLVAGLMNRGRGVAGMTVTCVLTLFGLVYLGAHGHLPQPVIRSHDLGRALTIGMFLSWMAVMVRATLSELDGALVSSEHEIESRTRTESDLRRSGEELQKAHADLRALNAELENRVQVRTRELSVAKEAALSASRAKSEFLAMMSHELRTPIAGIVGLAELLSHSELDKDQRSVLETLTSSTRTLLALLSDVLDYSKIEAGRLELEIIEFDLIARTNDVISLLRPQAEHKGLSLTVTIASDVPRYILGDPTRIQQVLFNLVGNAVKFTNSGEVVVTISREGERLVFAVRDTGIGMTDDVIQRVFKPFSQADTSTTRRYGGTGLGLSISSRLVELLGGTLTVQSTPGVGSIFSFFVRAPSAQTPTAEKPMVQPTLRPLHLLVAEDNQVNALVLTRLLQRLGHRCDCVTDGLQAVTSAAETAYDAIFMDMQMPVLDGPAATSKIRQLPGRAGKVPIIGLTADAVAQHRSGYVESGLSALLTKPSTQEQLQQVLGKVVLCASSEDLK